MFLSQRLVTFYDRFKDTFKETASLMDTPHPLLGDEAGLGLFKVSVFPVLSLQLKRRWYGTPSRHRCTLTALRPPFYAISGEKYGNQLAHWFFRPGACHPALRISFSPLTLWGGAYGYITTIYFCASLFSLARCLSSNSQAGGLRRE